MRKVSDNTVFCKTKDKYTRRYNENHRLSEAELEKMDDQPENDFVLKRDYLMDNVRMENDD